MKIIADVLQKIFLHRQCLVILGFILFHCSTPKQPYYFSRYSISKTTESPQSLQLFDSSSSNSLKNSDLFASTSQDPMVLSRVSKPEFVHKNAFTEKQLSAKQEQKIQPTWKAKRKVKSTSQADPSTGHKKNLKPLWYSLYFLALIIAFFTNSLYAVILAGVGLIFFGIMAARKNKKKDGESLKNIEDQKTNESPVKNENQNATENQEKTLDENAKPQKKKSKKSGLAIAAIILGALLLGFLLVSFLAFVSGS